jgi:O-glycosyl hydrolase
MTAPAKGNIFVSRPSRGAFRAALATSAAALSAMALSMAIPAAPALAADTATINGGQTYQTIAGFGASEAFGEAATVMNASSSVQQQTLSDLYSPTAGAGLTILRNEIGADSGSTIEPGNPGSPGAAPNYVSLASIDSDQGQLWFAQQIKQDFGVSNVFADAWSAPGFMKTNGSTANGGQVCGSTGASCSSGDWRQAYANYLVQYAKDYAAAGVPLSYIGPSNEPDYSASYDSMTMSPAQMASLLDVVGPTVKDSGLSTQVECCAATGWPVSGQYASAIESDPTALADTAVLTSHGYSGAPTSPLSGWTKPAWETEWSTFESWDPAWDDGTDASGMTWAQHIYQGLTGANLSAFLYWWGSTTPSENGDNEGLIEINGSTVQTSGRLWAFANYSRFIRPGAVRIAASSSNSGVDISAFKNTNGTVAIVALNTASSADPITYSLSGTGTGNGATVTPYLTNSSSSVAAQSATSVSNGSFAATIPARSLVTYVISGSGSTTGNTVTVTSPGNQSGTVGTAASVQIHASDSASGQTLSYSASGLPAGLSVNSATGLISGTPTTAGTSTVTVTAADSTGASGSATFTWTISGTTIGGTCQVSYATQSQWSGGFVAGITITNTGTTGVNGWTLKFTFPGDQQITDTWNGTATQSGENVTITNASYNGTISPGGNTTLGFQGTWTNSDATPTAFALNGTTCTT